MLTTSSLAVAAAKTDAEKQPPSLDFTIVCLWVAAGLFLSALLIELGRSVDPDAWIAERLAGYYD